MGIEPRISRRFLLGADANFAALHQAIQDAFGWQNYHLWEFRSGAGALAGPAGNADWEPLAPRAEGVRVVEHLKVVGDSCHYLYDFGDGWLHEVKLARRVEEGPTAFRELLAGERACPPEDCGGTPGYERLAEFVKTGSDPWDDSQGLLEWLGGWNPDDFDLTIAKLRF